eukprot:TRINITY_DN63852_c0_g1_i1.p1 TRINITY_DN63852_c0_g1~~TRINITY_DN63852_c0_g1_i1.p1  ORF type:complete len:208 (-),score=28.27 TRINITY_DN63852_c0_g1_i1:119-742(-)
MAVELFLHAASNGHIEDVCRLLERGRVCADVVVPPTNTTALHAACRKGNLEMAKLLLEVRSDVNACEAKICGGRAPLHLAVEGDYLSLTTALLQANADLFVRDSAGMTPLHTAAQEGRTDLTKILLSQGADPHLRDFDGHNAPWWAKQFRQNDVLEIYQDLHIDPRAITARERLVHAGVKSFARRKKKSSKRSKSTPASGATSPRRR